MRCRAEHVSRHITGIIPRVPLRHWVLTLPTLGVTLADAPPALVAVIVRAFVAALFGVFRRTTVHRGQRPPGRGSVRCGAVTVVVRRAPTLGPELSVHALMLDGVYATTHARACAADRAAPVFVPHAVAPGADEVAAAVGARLKDAWVVGRLRVDHAPVSGPPVGQAAAGIAATWHSGGDREPRPAAGVARGVAVSAGACIAPVQRDKVLELTRRLARPVAEPRRFSHAREGIVRYSLPFALSDGTSFVELSPQAIASCLGRRLGGAARRVRFHGILAAGSGRLSLTPSQLGIGAEPAVAVSIPPPGRLPPTHRLRSTGS